MWALIMCDRKTGLVVIRGNLIAQHYIDEVLRPVVVSPKSQYAYA